MTKRSDDALFLDMLKHATEACEFARGETRASLELDRKLRWALVKLVQIVGEAASRVSDEAKARYPAIPWVKLRGMRNVLVHQYEDIDNDTLWLTVSKNLPDLVLELRRSRPS